MTQDKDRLVTDLAVRDDQTMFDDKQLAALRQLGVQNASNADLAVFFHHVKRTGLDAFARQIYMIGRATRVPGTDRWETKQTIQTGIDGFRLIARRAVDGRHETLHYDDTLWCGPDGAWRDVWLSEEPPTAAKTVVYRNNQPFPAVALFREYAQTRVAKGKNGQPDEVVLSGQWPKMPSVMIAKCSEALALRKAFPLDLAGIYADEEMDAAEGPVVSQTGQAPAVEQPVDPDQLNQWIERITAADTTMKLNEVYGHARLAGVASGAVLQAFVERARQLVTHKDDKVADATPVDAEVVSPNVEGEPDEQVSA